MVSALATTLAGGAAHTRDATCTAPGGVGRSHGVGGDMNATGSKNAAAAE